MIKISDRISYVGVTDFSKTKFEGLWPLPYGVTYNSYIISDEKIALVDTVEGGFEAEFLKNIKDTIGDRNLDYLIVNHMEPDHASLVAEVRKAYPDVKIVASVKAVPMIGGYHGIPASEIIAVKEGDSICLGSCSLRFHMVPMVHWPETMVTWLEEENTLFSGDAFGTFGAVECSSEVYEQGHMVGAEHVEGGCFAEFRDEMIRYYSNIVGKYGAPVQAAIKKLGGLDIKRICSTHGPVWTSQIGEVVALYDKLSKYEAEKGVCIAYSSMYGNTELAAKALASELEKRGIPYGLHNLCLGDTDKNDLGQSGAIRDLFKYDTVAVGSPTYNAGVFPPAKSFMDAIAARCVKGKKFVAFGSYTWAAASIKLLDEMAVQSGQILLGESCSIAFPQAYSSEKCDMAAIAELIAIK